MAPPDIEKGFFIRAPHHAGLLLSGLAIKLLRKYSPLRSKSKNIQTDGKKPSLPLFHYGIKAEGLPLCSPKDAGKRDVPAIQAHLLLKLFNFSKWFFKKQGKVFIFFIGIMTIQAIFDFRRLQIFVGTKQTIPDRKYCAVIAVRVRLLPMVMHLMHIG